MYSDYMRFLGSDCEEEVMFKDQWCMTLEFLSTIKKDMSNFNENDAWPLMVFDFVDWVKNGCKKVEYDY